MSYSMSVCCVVLHPACLGQLGLARDYVSALPPSGGAPLRGWRAVVA